MKKSRRLFKGITLAAAVAGVLVSLNVAAASAAQWSAYPVLAKGSVTFDPAGPLAPVACNVEETWNATTSPKALRMKCPSQTLDSHSLITPEISGGKPSLFGIPIGYDNPWNVPNPWSKGWLNQPVVNGTSQASPSHMVMSNQAWGLLEGIGYVYATGKVNFTTPTGGLTKIIP